MISFVEIPMSTCTAGNILAGTLSDQFCVADFVAEVEGEADVDDDIDVDVDMEVDVDVDVEVERDGDFELVELEQRGPGLISIPPMMSRNRRHCWLRIITSKPISTE
jgi:hypothetical protein